MRFHHVCPETFILFRYSYHIAPLNRKLIRATHELNVSSQKEKIHDDIDSIFAADHYNFLPLERTILDDISFADLQAGIDYELLFLREYLALSDNLQVAQ